MNFFGKNDKKKRKGCLKNSLIFMLILVVCVLVIVGVILGGVREDNGDVRLSELLNRTYSAPFVDRVNDTQMAVTRSKINSSVRESNGASVIQNGVVDFDRLLSNEAVYHSVLELNGLDMAVLINDYFTSANIQDCVKAIDFTMQSIDARQIECSATFSINLENLALLLPFSVGDLPSIIYLTVSANFIPVVQVSEMVQNINFQINRLTGEDNTYALNALLEDLDIEQSELEEAVRYPFELIREQMPLKNLGLDISQNMFILTPLS